MDGHKGQVGVGGGGNGGRGVNRGVTSLAIPDLSCHSRPHIEGSWRHHLTQA